MVHSSVVKSYFEKRYCAAPTRRFAFEVSFCVVEAHFDKIYYVALSDERSNLVLLARGVYAVVEFHFKTLNCAAFSERRFNFTLYVCFFVAEARFEKLCCAAFSEKRSNRALYVRGLPLRGQVLLQEVLLRSSRRAALQPGALSSRCASWWWRRISGSCTAQLSPGSAPTGRSTFEMYFSVVKSRLEIAAGR